MGIDIQTQQKITAKLIQATTSFSESGKLVSPASSSDLALILQGDSLIKKEIGTADNGPYKTKIPSGQYLEVGWWHSWRE